MGDLRSAFLSKDFVINSNIVKCISSLDISLEEFLLVLYFLNVSPILDIDDIKDKLGFDEEKITDTFSKLLNKKYIELDVKNGSGKVVEMVKLDPLLDRLALNKKEEKDNSDIYSLFENEFGRTLSPIEAEMINSWLEKGISEDIIRGALKEAVLNGVRKFKYIDKIVYDWSKNGVKNRVKEDDSNNDLFDYDWLEEDE